MIASNSQKKRKCLFPRVYAIDKAQGDNQIRQLAVPARTVEVLVEPYELPGLHGQILTPIERNSVPVLVIVRDSNQPPQTEKGQKRLPVKFKKVLSIPSDTPLLAKDGSLDLSLGSWIRHPDILDGQINYKACLEGILKSWQGAFSLAEEFSPDHMQGLRTPQIGAIHAVFAHWAMSDDAATIVMPTGTGKTEVMLAVLISNRCPRLLVVVPTDALRTQIAERFLSLGILKGIGVVSEAAQYPIVGYLRNKPKDIAEVDAWFTRCNVIVTTMQIAGQCAEEVQERIALHCPYLFVDEAHHLGAQTWSGFKKMFARRRILQFTATPFRNDDRLVEGRIIFNYPLKKALEDGYFKPIHFKPVEEYDPAKMDQAIVEKAVSQLRKDLKAGFDHILMARVENISRAKEVLALYERYPEFEPVQLHTGIKSENERQRIKDLVLGRKSRIVVCVDMLGEGFDLPELKIAAFHDVKKSLPVTLQVTGRFTRARADLGEPTVIANTGDVDVRDELRRLYSQDADWNTLLPQSSHTVIQKQVELLEFLEGFKNLPADIPLQNLRPNLYTVMYQTTCDSWKPENYKEGLDEVATIKRAYFDTNYRKDTAIILLARHVPLDWADVRDMFSLEWELILLFWDRKQQILFINSAGCKSHCRKLAEAVMGKGNVMQIRGSDLFRSFSGIRRLKLQNVGLKVSPAGHITYTMLAGPDVVPGLTTVQKAKGVASNLSGSGYEDSQRVSLGCSSSGRVWSQKPDNLSGITRSCSYLGTKIMNKRINPDTVLKGTLIPRMIDARPKKMPISIEWPEVFYTQPETAHRFILKTGRRKIILPLFNTDIRLMHPAITGDIQFEIRCDPEEISRELILSVRPDGYTITGGANINVVHGGRERPLDTFLDENPPTIWFHDGSFLEGNRYSVIPKRFAPYPKKKIDDWDWKGVNIRKESQVNLKKAGQVIIKEKDSIQYCVIHKLLGRKKYVMVFDDDSSGESADIVCVWDKKTALEVEFYHCKFSQGDDPGSRIDDLYAVCGQAQASVQWAPKPEELFDHLLMREPRTSRKLGQTISRFEEGDLNTLKMLKNKSMNLPVNFKIFIVQPGLSKAAATDEQLILLSVTEDYLKETFKVPFGVISGP